MKHNESRPEFIHSPQWHPGTPTVISVGAFDGIHSGHRMIIEKLTEEAKQHQASSLLFTFHPHPKQILFPEKPLKLLTVLPEKKHVLQSYPLDYVLFYPFTRSFSELTGKEFLMMLKEKYKVRKLLLGYNHRFGSDRLNDDETIRRIASDLGFEAERLPKVEIDGIAVSSSEIKRRIAGKDIETARKLLSYPYLMTGAVVQGNRFGRKIGFPTANLRVLSSNKLIPPEGVYLVRVTTEHNVRFGVMNIGRRPTVDGTNLVMEVHLIDFSGNLYGQTLRIGFLAFLRNEKHFQNVGQLKFQIEKDIRQAESIIKSRFT